MIFFIFGGILIGEGGHALAHPGYAYDPEPIFGNRLSVHGNHNYHEAI